MRSAGGGRSKGTSLERGAAGILLWIVSQAQFHANLEMANFAIDDVTLDLCHLEPLKMTESFRRRLNAVLNGVLDTGFR